jgi:hypothetical protein
MTDAWEQRNRLDPLDPADAALDPDSDDASSLQEWMADTDPHDSNDFFRLVQIEMSSVASLTCRSSTGRWYSLEYALAVPATNWLPVTGQQRIIGQSNALTLWHTNAAAFSVYRTAVSISP